MRGAGGQGGRPSGQELAYFNPAALFCLILLFDIFIVVLQEPIEVQYALLPCVASISLCSVCVLAVWKSDKQLPIADIGVFCVLLTTLYSTFPLLNFYFGGLQFGPLSDTRLQQYDPRADELGRFFSYHVFYLASLVFGYLMFRTKAPSRRVRPAVVMDVDIRVLVVVYLVIECYFQALSLAGIGFKSGYGDESGISLGPLWVQQLNGKLIDLQFVFWVALLGFLILRKRENWAVLLLVGLATFEVATAFLRPGSRGELVNLVLICAVFWGRFYPSRRIGGILFVVAAAFSAFMFIGIYRSFSSGSELVGSVDSAATLASATNEFQAVFATAYDVFRRVNDGLGVPSFVYFNDVMPLLPPRQFLPFTKMSASDWYLTVIGQEGTGVGFMWSVVSQAIVGFGVAEVVFRGLLLGWFLAIVHSWYMKRERSFLATVLYVVFCLTTLWTFRDTTGAIVWVIVLQIIPFCIIIYMFADRIGRADLLRILR